MMGGGGGCFYCCARGGAFHLFNFFFYNFIFLEILASLTDPGSSYKKLSILVLLAVPAILFKQYSLEKKKHTQ